MSGLLTGAEPTAEAHAACFVQNEADADITNPRRAESLFWWMRREFFRSQCGREWRLITNW